MHENEVTPEKLGADLKLLISDAEALLRATVGEPQELPESTRDIGTVSGRLLATGNPARLSQRNTSSSRCKKSTNSRFTRIRVFRKSSAG